MKVLSNSRIEDIDFDRNLLTKAFENNYREAFRHNTTYECPENTFRLKDLVVLAAFYDVEFAIYKKDGNLFVQKGEQTATNQGVAGHVRIPEGATMLVHTHPCYRSYSYHLENDLNRSLNKEVVVDFSYTIIVYQDNEVFNKKDENTHIGDSPYLSLSVDNPNWPDFLTKDTPDRVCVKL